MFLKHRLLPWIYASLAGFLLATATQTQFVLHRLAALDIALPLGVRLQTTVDDILGLAPTYLPVIAIGLAIALPVASVLIARLKPTQRKVRTFLFALAGFTALASILLSMEPIMNITLIAGARGMAGLLAQCAAGAVAGWVYAVTAPSKSSSRSA